MANLRNSTVSNLNLCSNAPYNTAFGCGALFSNTAGCGSNTAIGYDTLSSNTTGIKNTAIGLGSLNGNSTSYRTGLGSAIRGQDAYTTTIGSNVGGVYSGCHTGNIAIGSANSGKQAYANSITVGYCAGHFSGFTANISIGHLTRTGNNCAVFIGNGAGYQGGGNCSILIGYGAGCANGNATNNILIGYGASQQNGFGCNDQTVLGNGNNNVYNCVYTAWTDVSDCRDKTNVQPINNLGLNFLRKLNPVKYKWDLRQKYTNECGYEYGIKDGTLKQDQINYGFLAQEIEFAAKSLGENFDAVTHDTFIDQYSLNYLNLLASLTKALQEINNDLDLIETQLNS